MNARLVKPVKHDLSSRSSVFTPVSPISKTEILSGKYPVTFYRITEFYRIPVFGSGTSLINIHPLFFIYRKQAKYRRNTGVSRQDLIGCRSGRFFAMSGHSHGNLNTKIILNWFGFIFKWKKKTFTEKYLPLVSHATLSLRANTFPVRTFFRK